MWAKKQQLEAYMEQLTGLKLGEEYSMSVYCHLFNLICMQITSWEMPAWISYKPELRLLREISTNSDIHMISL